MSISSQNVRAFRPSRYAEVEANDDEATLTRQANLEVYALRAQAGLPLFEAADLHIDSPAKKVAAG